MSATTNTTTTDARGQSWPLQHPWLTTWIALSAIAGAVQVLELVFGGRRARLFPRAPRPFAPAPVAPDRPKAAEPVSA